MLKTCPMCNNNAIARVQNEHGNKYYLAEVDTSSTPYRPNPSFGVTVDIDVCTGCGHMMLSTQEFAG